MSWQDTLKPILVEKIEEALRQADDELWVPGRDRTQFFPWLGDNCNELFADAVILQLKAMGDSQEFLRGEGMLKE